MKCLKPKQIVSDLFEICIGNILTYTSRSDPVGKNLVIARPKKRDQDTQVANYWGQRDIPISKLTKFSINS